MNSTDLQIGGLQSGLTPEQTSINTREISTLQRTGASTTVLTGPGGGGGPLGGVLSGTLGAAAFDPTRMTLTTGGQLQLAIAGSAGGLRVGGDAALYRSAPNTLRTSSTLFVDGHAAIKGPHPWIDITHPDYPTTNGVQGSAGWSTSDVGAAINAAVAALPAFGGWIFMPAGNYRLATAILIDKPVKLTGAGMSGDLFNGFPWTGTTMLTWAGASGGTMVTVTSPKPDLDTSAGVSIAKTYGGFELDGFALDGSGTALIGFNFNRARGGKIGQLGVQRLAANGIAFDFNTDGSTLVAENAMTIQARHLFAIAPTIIKFRGSETLSSLSTTAVAANAGTTSPQYLDAATFGVASTAGWPSTGYFTVFGNTVQYTGISGNSFTGCTTDVGHVAAPDGNPVTNALSANSCLINIDKIDGQYSSATGTAAAGPHGIVFESSDDITLGHTFLNRHASSTAFGVEFANGSRGHTIFHLEGEGGACARTPTLAGLAGNGVESRILHYSRENNEPSPTIEAGATLSWQEDGRGSTGLFIHSPNTALVNGGRTVKVGDPTSAAFHAYGYGASSSGYVRVAGRQSDATTEIRGDLYAVGGAGTGSVNLQSSTDHDLSLRRFGVEYLRLTTAGVLLSKALTLANLAAAPSSPADGMAYYNTATGDFEGRKAGAWVSLTAGGGGDVVGAGLPGGQSVSGGDSTLSGGNLVLHSTLHATKGAVTVGGVVASGSTAGDNFGINTNVPITSIAALPNCSQLFFDEDNAGNGLGVGRIGNGLVARFFRGASGGAGTSLTPQFAIRVTGTTGINSAAKLEWWGTSADVTLARASQTIDGAAVYGLNVSGYLQTSDQPLLMPSGFAMAITPVSASVAMNAHEVVLPVDASGAARTITLPPANAAAALSQIVVIRKTDSSANLVTIQRAGTDLIEGAATSITLATQYDYAMLHSDGSGSWWRLQPHTLSRLNSTDAKFSGALAIAGAATLSSTLAVTGAATLSSTLAVTGATTPAGGVLDYAGSTPPSTGWLFPAQPFGALSGFTQLTPTANRVYVEQVELHRTQTFTGITVALGAAAAGNALSTLYDAAGNKVASSGSTAMTGGVNTYSPVPFTTPYTAKGPGRYFIAVSTDTATANLFRAWGANAVTTAVRFLSGYVDPGSFSTPATITPPAAWDSSITIHNPLMALYGGTGV
jgi:hypothetical protein